VGGRHRKRGYAVREVGRALAGNKGRGNEERKANNATFGGLKKVDGKKKSK